MKTRPTTIVLAFATDDLLGVEKWGVGPTAVALKQDDPWTYVGSARRH